MSTVKLFFLLSLLCLMTKGYADTINVAAIDWCPQICVNGANAGYTVDLIKKVYEKGSYDLKIDIFPWSRAIKYVSEGKYDALLAPAKKEAPHLVFPRFGVGLQTMCFFTSAKNTWKYSGEDSLSSMQIGIAFDTSVEELNGYIKKHPEQFQFQPYHERYVAQNAGKILKGRIDAFLFTKNTTQHELKKAGLEKGIQNAGCVSQADIYLAFTADKEKSEGIDRAVRFFDFRMEHLIQSGFVDTLHRQYDIK